MIRVLFSATVLSVFVSIICSEIFSEENQTVAFDAKFRGLILVIPKSLVAQEGRVYIGTSSLDKDEEQALKGWKSSMAPLGSHDLTATIYEDESRIVVDFVGNEKVDDKTGATTGFPSFRIFLEKNQGGLSQREVSDLVKKIEFSGRDNK